MNTLIIAKIVGIYVIVSGLFIVFRGKTLPLLLKDFFAHRAVMWLAGLVLIILGGLLAFGTVGSALLTVLGWLILIKGIIYILAPEFVVKFTLPKYRSLLTLLGLIAILIGVVLLWSTWGIS